MTSDLRAEGMPSRCVPMTITGEAGARPWEGGGGREEGRGERERTISAAQRS